MKFHITNNSLKRENKYKKLQNENVTCNSTKKLRKNKSEEHISPIGSTTICNCVKSGAIERSLFHAFTGTASALNKMHLLRHMIYYPAKLVAKQKVPELPSGEVAKYVTKRVSRTIQEGFSDKKGRLKWKELTDFYRSKLLKNGGQTFIDNPRFQSELEELIGLRFNKNNKVKLLADGPAAFGKRYRILDKQPKRVYVSSYHIESDATGKELSKKLAKLAQSGSDVRVLVDKKIFSIFPADETFKIMQNAGVKIAYWENSNVRLGSLHAKIFIADDQAIIGGTNYANRYSHGFNVEDKYFSNQRMFRDTDILLNGVAALDLTKSFISLWNDSVGESSLKMDPLAVGFQNNPYEQNSIRTPYSLKRHEEELNKFPPVKVKDPEVSVALTQPTENLEQDGNTAGMLKLIWGAQKQIDIENAYYIRMPFFSEALIDALKRGVNVRIYTNSESSVDEKSIGSLINKSLHELIVNGAKVYLKNGEDTLHSKFMQVDEKYSWIGSYNMNPRSVRYDCEIGCFVKNEKFAKNLKNIFDMDVDAKNATSIKQISELSYVSNIRSRFLEHSLYDHT